MSADPFPFAVAHPAVDERPVPDLFGGPGGWDIAAKWLGIATIGFESDPVACETRRAAGHATVEGDLRGSSPRDYLARGSIGSPPCQGFSLAGNGKGRTDSVLLLEVLSRVNTATELDAAIAYLHDHMTDDRTLLVLEPLRWTLATMPSWIAWEQVPMVLPIWEAAARILRLLGYSVETAVLTAEMYGVPQTRRRAILVARAPWLAREIGPVALPAPTHSRYHVRNPARIDPGMPRWVSMAEALSWGLAQRPSFTVTTGSAHASSGVEWGGGSVRDALDEARTSGDPGRWQPREGDPGWGATDRPAPTVTGGGTETGGAEPFGNSGRKALVRERDAGRWRERTADGEDRVRNQSGNTYDLDAQVAAPATALATRNLVGFRGVNANRFNGSTKSRNDGIRITVEEAAILQTFPADYPLAGNKGKRFQQIGNAIPPLLAAHVLAAATGIPFEEAS